MDYPSFESFTGRPRIRVCGLLPGKGGLLMVNHKGLYGRDFWAPPGGGAKFGERPLATLAREFQEECGLEVGKAEYLFTCSVIRGEIHALELFFKVDKVSGTLQMGGDPEFGNNQIINSVSFLSFEDLRNIQAENLHPIFSGLTDPSDILKINGFHERT